MAAPAGAAVYTDALGDGWGDWTGTWATRDLANPSPVASGAASISVTYAPWGGLYLHRTAALSTAGLAYLDLSVNGGATDGANIVVYTTVADVAGPHVAVGPYCAAGKIPANAWTRCRVPLAALQAVNVGINGLVLRLEQDGATLPPMYFDDLALVQAVRLPGAPSRLSAKVSGTAVSLSWRAVTGATSYQVYRATAPSGAYAALGTTAGTTYADATVSPGVTYLYAVSASNAAGEGPRSAAATAAIPQAVGVTVTPATAAVAAASTQAFASAVTGTSNTAVTWTIREGAAGGAVSAGGLYTAPAAAGTYHVVVTSAADPTKSAAAVVTVGAAAQTVAISLSPAAVSLTTGSAQAFTATVTGSSNTGVSWSVQETSGCGAVSSTGVYTSPSAPATCHVIARSAADSTKAATATVTVSAPPSTSDWSARCAAEPLRTTGTTYYVCDCQAGADPGCVAGNDANAGTSPSAPLRTWVAASGKWQSMNAGDTVALCKGGRFDGSGAGGFGNWRNTRCSASSASTTCILRDYQPPWGPNVTAAPAVAVTGTQTPIMIGGGIAVQGYRMLNLHFLNTAGGGQGIWDQTAGVSSDGIMINGLSGSEFCNNVYEGFRIGFYVQMADTTNLHGNRILNSCMDGALAIMTNSEWDGNYFDNNGHDACDTPAYRMIDNPSGGTTHTMYFDCNQPYQCANNRFVNNQMYRTTVDPRTNACRQNALSFAGLQANILIENNYWESTTTPGSNCTWLAGGAYVSTESESNLTVRRNHLKTHEGAVMSYANVTGMLIEDNVITSTGTTVSGSNAFWDTDQSLISVPHNNGSPIASNATIRNNTIYIAGNIGATRGWSAISVTRNGSTGANVTGNSVYVAPGGALSTCFKVANPAGLAYMDNNSCSGAANYAYVNSADAMYTLAGWQSFAGRDGHSSTTTPTFVSAPANLAPAAGSSLVGAASTASTCTINGAANQPCSSAIAADPTWSPTAAAQTRSGAPAVGALQP
jgi:hypothetical protein